MPKDRKRKDDYGKIYREVFREIPDRTTHPGFREIMAQWQARGGIDVRLYGDSQRYKDWSESDGTEYVHLSDLMNDMYVKNIFVNPEFFQSPLIIDVGEQTKPPKVAYAGWTPNSQKVRNVDIIRVPRDLSKWLFDDPWFQEQSVSGHSIGQSGVSQVIGTCTFVTVFLRSENKKTLSPGTGIRWTMSF